MAETKVNRNLGVARAKVHQFSGRTWCGYLTPSEILALIKAGAKPDCNNLEILWIQAKKDSGDSRPGWFYFTPPKGW